MNYFDLKGKQKQIELQRINIRQLREKAVSVTQTLNDMPHGSGGKDKLGIAISQIDEQENRLKFLELEFEQALCDIPNAYIRKLIVCKLKYRWSWTKIAITLGGNNTSDSVRMMCTRYKW